MKKIIDKVKDNLRTILQIFLLLICIFFPKFIKLSDTIRELLKNQRFDIFNIKYYWLAKLGNFNMGILLMIFVLYKYIHKSNGEKTLFTKNVYHNYPYIWFWFCSKILGYNSCSLMLVPIPMQFKLVIEKTFKDYSIPFENILEKDMDILVEYYNKNKENINEVNLVLEDTYSITQNQIPESKRPLPTIIIKHNREPDGTRIYNAKFVEEICRQVRTLPEKTIINIYSTTNPNHNYHIANQAFKLANRGNVKELYVYQQEKSDIRKFSKRKKIYSH